MFLGKINTNMPICDLASLLPCLRLEMRRYEGTRMAHPCWLGVAFTDQIPSTAFQPRPLTLAISIMTLTITLQEEVNRNPFKWLY
jgi:hypothetical protein